MLRDVCDIKTWRVWHPSDSHCILWFCSCPMYRKCYDCKKVRCARPINSIYRVMELLTLCFNQNVTCVTCVTQKICVMWHVPQAILISCSNGLTFLVLRLKSLSPCLKSGIQPLLGWTIWAVIPIFYHRVCLQVASHTSRYTLWLEFHLYFGPLHELIDFFSGKTIIWLELTKTSLTKVFWNILKSVAITYLENVTCVT